jgi:broad specificity phosphatase PhoE
MEMVLALRTFVTRTDVLESLSSRKGAAYAARNTLENRLRGQTDAGNRVVGSCQASAVCERLSRGPQEARVSSRLGRARSTAQMSARQQALPVQEGTLEP